MMPGPTYQPMLSGKVVLQAGYQLNIPRLFAALVLITFTDILLFIAMAMLSKWALGGWHESEMN